MKISVSAIKPNPQQPRKFFDESAMLELASSIRENGLQSPILVEDNGDGTYTLVAGERRCRAHQMLQIPEIDAIIRHPTNHAGRQRLLDAMTENVQRQSMSPVEEAQGYRRMRDEFGMSIADIARAMGTSYNAIYQRLRITELEPEIQELIGRRELPGSTQAVEAFLKVPDSQARVKVAKALATRSATIRMVQNACEKLAAALAAAKPSGIYAKIPAVHVGGRMAKVVLDDIQDGWDALYQVNRVPKWPIYVETIQATCLSCSLYSHASDATCRDCPLVDSVRRMLEAVDAKRA